MKKAILAYYALVTLFPLYGEPIIIEGDSDTNEVYETLVTYVKHGDTQYMIGESVTQKSHALQTAYLLKTAGAPHDVIAAGFLHDIGQLIDQNHLGDTHYLHIHHADIGANWLKEKGYPDLVVDCARFHTLAKIHLCKTSSTYQQRLSPASQESLLIQQQHYTEEQYQKFLALPYLDKLLAIRKCDDMAKQPDFDSFELDDMIRPLLIAKGLIKFAAVPVAPEWMQRVEETFAIFAQQQNASKAKSIDSSLIISI